MIKIIHLWKSDIQRSLKHLQGTEAEENTLEKNNKANGFIKQSCDSHRSDLKIKNMNIFRKIVWPRLDIAF